MKSKLIQFKSFVTLVVLGLSLVIAGQAWAQNSALETKKAILVSKFIKYVEWPEQAVKKEFKIGVYEDVELYSFLSNYFAKKAVKGKNIVVTLVDNINETKKVNLLYIPAAKSRDLFKIAAKTTGSYVLLISENNKNIAKTMVNFVFNQEKSKIAIKINYANTKREKLKVPETSYFLDGKNDANVLALSEQAVKQDQLKKELKTLNKYVLQQKNQLSQLKGKLSANEEKLAKYNLALKQQTAKLKIAQKQNDKQQKTLASATKKVEKLSENLANKTKQLNMTKKEWLGAEAEKSAQQEAKIKELSEKIAKQEKLVKTQISQLAKAKKQNKQLASYSSLFYIALIIALVALVIAGLFWSRNKKSTAIINEAEKVAKEAQSTLATREQQLVKSENIAALGYIASDVTYAAGNSVEDALEHSVKIKDLKNIETLKPAVALLENYNQIAADQDEDEKQSFDLVAYTNKLMSLFSVEFQASDIQYIFAGESKLVVNSIPGHIALVLLNLVNNSIKHGFDNKGNGKISILIEKTPQGGAKLVVQDNGAGMDKKTQQKIFTPFFTTKPERGYLGLGMSTVEDIVKNKLAANIKLQSQTGKGTTITITL